MKKKLKRQSEPPIPVPTAKPELELPDFLELVCPSCSTHWANARIRFGKKLRKSDFSIREDLEEQVTFQKNGLPVCPLCQYKFTPQDIYGIMMSAMARRKMEGKLWSRDRYQSPELP